MVRPLAETERAQIALAMREFHGDKRAAALALGVSLNTLYNRLNEYGESFDWEAFVEKGQTSPSALWFWDFYPPQVIRRPDELVAQSIELHIGKFCVYEHIRDGEVVYVGMGQWNRPFSYGRNGMWDEEMEKYGPIQIRVLDWFDDERVARAFETETIKYRKPRLNIAGNNALFNSFDFAALPA